MSQGYNKQIIIGNLGDAPELKETKNGKSLAKMSVAVNTGFGDHERTDWFDTVVWGKQAEACANHLNKGSRVLVEGEMRQNKWEDDNGKKHSRFELSAHKVVFLGNANNGAASADQAPVQEDDIPF